jgi:O-antigen/teichoic acid export membrane protein
LQNMQRKEGQHIKEHNNKLTEQPHGDRYSKLASNTVLFAISSFSSKLLSLVMQPFLTHALKETSVVGVAKLASQCANFLIPFVSLGMSNAIIRFGLDKRNDKKQVFTNGLLTILLGYFLLIVAWPLLNMIPTVSDYVAYLYIYVLTSCLRTLCTQFVRSRQLNRLVAIDGILCTFATLLFYVLYMIIIPMGAAGYLLAIICGDLVSSIFLFTVAGLWRYLDFTRLNKVLWKDMLKFSLPMIPAQISFWIINVSDLFFVKYMCNPYGNRTGDDWSGLLSTGYYLPTILNTIGLIFYDAWQLSAVTEESEREAFFSRIFRLYSGLMFCCTAGIIWLCRPAMHIFRYNFYDAWRFVPFLTIAAVFTCFNQFFNSIYVVYKRSISALYTMMAGAAVNCVLDYVFILWWGPVGATVASAVGMLVVFVLRAVNTRGLLAVNFKPGRLAVNLGLLVAEAGALLSEMPFYGIATTAITVFLIWFNWHSVWSMIRLILPKVLGQRGRRIVSFVDRRTRRPKRA